MKRRFILISFAILSIGACVLGVTLANGSGYPNPFRVERTISYGVAEPSKVLILVYNIDRNIVDTLVNERQDAGEHSFTWDTKDVNGGIYFLKITTTVIKKQVVMK